MSAAGLIVPFDPSLLNPALATAFLSSQAAELTDSQRAAHRVDDTVYRHAGQVFGAPEVFDIFMPIGSYHVVCEILSTFTIPRPDDAYQR